MNLVPSPFTITSFNISYPADGNPAYAAVCSYNDPLHNLIAGSISSACLTTVRWPLYKMGMPPSGVSNLTISLPTGQYQLYFSPGGGDVATSIMLQDLTSQAPYPNNQRVLWTAPASDPTPTSANFTLNIDATQWAANHDGISLASC